jgi:hypothetical protein
MPSSFANGSSRRKRELLETITNPGIIGNYYQSYVGPASPTKLWARGNLQPEIKLNK